MHMHVGVKGREEQQAWIVCHLFCPGDVTSLVEATKWNDACAPSTGRATCTEPMEAVVALLDEFPLRCLDMEGFFAAYQYAYPNTWWR